jgi:hypothetical protein
VPAHTVRVDLVSAQTGGDDHLAGLPPGAQATLDHLRPQLGRVAYTHMDSGMVRTRGDGGVKLLSGGQQIHTDLHLSGASAGAERVRVDLGLRASDVGPQPPGDDDPLQGTLLHTSLDLPVGETTVAGVTRLSAERNLVVLVTATR